MISKNEVKNILITRTDRIGDVILTLPLVTAAKEIFKDAKIFLLVKKNLKDLLYDYEGIDELLIDEEVSTFSDKYSLFTKKKPDMVINVKPRFDLALLFFLLRVKYRIGTGYRWYSFLYNYRVYEHRKESVKHESEYNLNLLKHFFSEVNTVRVFNFKYSKEEKNLLETKLEIFKFSLKDNFIIIHPGSGGSAKDLPKEKFSEFIDLFIKEFPGYRIAMTGLNGERILTEIILSNVDKELRCDILDLTGYLSLRELMILTDHCKLFVANSTGPIHIAGALNKNVIGFYPNEKPMSQTRWKPPGRNVRIISPVLTDDDMSSIKAGDIIESAKKIIN